ncbi:MAG: AbrB family transcriptional regulator [Pseudolabrys sp.]|nr:AbrB family transcriptional regulator [Pseudolabrys sp.]
MAFAAAGGMIFGLAGMPGGWLSGAILFVACAALAGRPMYVPLPLNRVIFILIGVSLGAVVTPETLHGVVTYPVSVLTLIAAMGFVSWFGGVYLERVHKWDRLSAFLGAAPGGMSQCVAVATELDADVRAIVIVQTVRVVLIAVGLPALLTLLGLVAPSSRGVGGDFSLANLDELLILLGVSTLVATIAYRIRFPGGLLFGSMLASAILHGSGLIHAVMPWWAANAAMITLGGVTGSRFANTPIKLLLRFIGAALGSFVVSIAIAGVFAGALVMALSLRVADVTIAFAPGSVDAMMLLALALNTDPVYVGAHHFSRIFFVSLTMPLIAKHQAKLEHKVVDESKLPPPTPDDED